jgi:Bacterial Ig-like domain (group 1)
MKSGLLASSFKNTKRFVITGAMLFMLASCGGGGGSPGTLGGTSTTSTTTPATTTTTTTTTTATVDVGAVSLLFSNSELKSAGIAGNEVTVTALVKSATNNALIGVPVTFTADSGALSNVSAVTDNNGKATALLGTSGDHTNRTITITAKAGTQTVTGIVNVVGTTLAISGPSSITIGSTGDVGIVARDSAGNPVVSTPISFTSKTGNKITVKTSGGGTATAPLTNGQGQVVLTLNATQVGIDTISVTGQGANASQTVNVSGTKLNVTFPNTATVLNATGIPLNQANITSTTCELIKVHYEINGVAQVGNGVNLSTSRGKIYADNTCVTEISGTPLQFVAGDSQAAYVKSDTAGIATITASVVNGPSAQGNIEFIAVLTSAATISLQSTPAVIGTNSSSGQAAQSTLTAIVRDGTVNNNLVKNAVVKFNIVKDASGGSLANPSVVTTGSNGAASVIFTAGSAVTAKDGVDIQATIQSIDTSAAAHTLLTVSQQPLFISAGTGNTVSTPSSTQYQVDYAVFVTDASGGPASGVAITASVIPTAYFKGFYSIPSAPASQVWTQFITAPSCPNEDTNQNGILDLLPSEDTNGNGILDPGEDTNQNGILDLLPHSEDTNGNGRLDPGIPLTVTTSGVTAIDGTAVVSILYPRDRGNWTKVKLLIRGSVAGTEAVSETNFTLPVLATDLTTITVSPPGNTSPYGRASACSDPN